MTSNFGSKHKVRGRHFKLFSDELPVVDLDRVALEELETARTDRSSRDRKGGTPRGAHTDRMSLPSLKTPDWELLSDSDFNRPSSMQLPFNPLSPNFAKAQQRVRRRHTFRERNNNSVGSGGNIHHRVSFKDTFVNENNRKGTEAWVRHATPEFGRVSKNDLEELGVDHLAGKAIHVLSEKPPTPKKKSVFKTLLDASEKESVRMSRIREGLQFNDAGKHVKRSQSLRHVIRRSVEAELASNDNLEYSDYRVPEVISDQSEMQNKPGILKHGERMHEVKYMCSLKRGESYLRPRLVHQENLPLLRTGNASKEGGNEVRISVYTESPLNRIHDMKFVSLPASKTPRRKKRVNFQHAIIKEITELSESGLNEVDDEMLNKKSEFKVLETRKGDKDVKTVPIKNDVEDVDQSMAAFKTNRSSEFPLRKSKRRKAKVKEDKRDYIDTILMSAAKSENDANAVNGQNEALDYRDGKNLDKSELPDEVDIIAKVNSPVDFRPVGSKLRRQKHVHKDQDKIRRRSVKTHDGFASPLGIGTHQHETSKQHLSDNKHDQQLHLEDQSVNGRRDQNKKPHHHQQQQQSRQHPDMTKGYEQEQYKDQYSYPKDEQHFEMSETPIDVLSELSDLFDDEDFDINNLPDEIDRSMLGEDLIKAYRLWDRKRKAFPGGLRKIEAPPDRINPVLAKHLAKLKSYKLTSSQKVDVGKASVTNTGQTAAGQKNVLVEWV